MYIIYCENLPRIPYYAFGAKVQVYTLTSNLHESLGGFLGLMTGEEFFTYDSHLSRGLPCTLVSQTPFHTKEECKEVLSVVNRISNKVQQQMNKSPCFCSGGHTCKTTIKPKIADDKNLLKLFDVSTKLARTGSAWGTESGALNTRSMLDIRLYFSLVFNLRVQNGPKLKL